MRRRGGVTMRDGAAVSGSRPGGGAAPFAANGRSPEAGQAPWHVSFLCEENCPSLICCITDTFYGTRTSCRMAFSSSGTEDQYSAKNRFVLASKSRVVMIPSNSSCDQDLSSIVLPSRRPASTDIGNKQPSSDLPKNP